ncbi:MAG: 3-hydroxyanthranilate 3,4-dioxygenase [Bdellovibrionota bacterium]
MLTNPTILLREWIEKHQKDLAPPVGNKELWKDQDFVVMMVAGPNQRKDFHIEEGPEFFYQIQGNILLRVITEKGVEEISIKEGEVYLLPPRVPHCPIRPEGTLGMVIERKRLCHELDHIAWFCESCGEELFRKSFHLKDIETQLPDIFREFYSDNHKRRCSACNEIFQPPAGWDESKKGTS